MSYEFKPYPFEPKRYEPRLPDLVDGLEAKRHPVVIIGAGPVGLSTALGLANHGIASLVLEIDDTVCHGSRAICISRRSLEIVERLGALKPFLKTGLPWTGGRSYYRDTEVLRFEMLNDENQKLPAMVNLEQYYIEQFLLDAAEKRPDLIEIRWQTELTGLTHGPDGARLSVSTPKGDYTLDTDWLIACDGGRSRVREALGLTLKGASYEGRYLVADIAIKSDRPVGRLAYFDPPSNPGSTILVHIQPDDIWRIDYQLGDDEDSDEAVKPENVIPRVASHIEMMGESSDWSPVWITLYRAHARSLDTYRYGRVLFAGDAAHLVPIFGVRGANSAIDDADNLAWKLALVLKGLAPERLIDSFSQERVAAAHENMAAGMKSTEFMAPPSFAFELMREAVLSLAEHHPEVRSLINPRQTTAIIYADSPLNALDSDPLPAGPGPGAVLVEAPLTLREGGQTRESHVTELVGPRFTALHFSEDGVLPADLAGLDLGATPFRAVPIARRALPDGPGPSAWDHTGRLFPLYGAEPGTLYLIRPDGHVLGRWRKGGAAEVAAALKRVLQP